MDSDYKIVSMYSKSDGVISLWGRSFIWHTCYTLTEGLIHLSNLRSECDCACKYVCVCACVKVSLCTERYSVHVRNIREHVRKRNEPIPWALEECSMAWRWGLGLLSMCPLLPLPPPLVVKIAGKGGVLKALSWGSIFGFCGADIPRDNLMTWESPGVKAEPINLHYLYLPHTPVPTSTISTSLHHPVSHTHHPLFL